jgi:Niemann-Pick C1 protein
MSVAMGMILAYGLCSLFGLFYSAAHTVIPFLLLGIGIDNIFVITQVYKMFYLFNPFLFIKNK